jgi:hypothetical protein
MRIVLLTIINMSLIPAALVAARFTWYNYYYWLTVPVALSLAVTVLSVAMLARYEGAAKHGDAIFQELSNLIQEYDFQARDAHMIRVTVRDFSNSTDLPLIPGRFGVSAYAGLNLVSTVVVSLVALA